MKQEQIHKPKPKETHHERRKREEQEEREAQHVPYDGSEDTAEEIEKASETVDDIDRVLGELVLANVGTENPGNHE